MASRAESLKSEHRLDSLLSREAVFLLNNFVLVALCFVVFWGTFFPLIAEAVTGRQRNIGPPVYERFVVPLALILVLLAGIGPLIAWRRATAANLRRNLGRPALVGVAVVVAAARARRHRLVDRADDVRLRAASWSAAIGQELWRGVRARRAVARETVPVALVSLVRRNRRRYGGYFVHVGIVVLFVGVAASSSVQGRPRRRAAARARARASAATSSPTSSRSPSCTPPPTAASSGSRSAPAQRARGRQDATTAHLQGLLPVPGPDGRAGLALLRRRVDDRGRRCDAGLHKDVWAAVAPDIVKLRPRIEEGDRLFTKAARRPHARAVRRVPRARAARPDRALRGRPAARALPLRGQPARHLDLARRPDRLFGGLRRRLAGAARADRRASARYAARVGRDVREHVPAYVELVLILLVVAAAPCGHHGAAAARRARATSSSRPSAPSSRRPGGQVPRDPRRRTRLPHRQALRAPTGGRWTAPCAPRRSSCSSAWTGSERAEPLP